eukprot:6282450-Amphidinium_carterae.2
MAEELSLRKNPQKSWPVHLARLATSGLKGELLPFPHVNGEGRSSALRRSITRHTAATQQVQGDPEA